MANFIAIRSGRCWKEHTCCLCGSVFRYRMDRCEKGLGATLDEAETRVQLVLESRFKNGCDSHACPVCGYYQPEMFLESRHTHHFMTTLISALALVGLFVLGAADLVNIPLLTLLSFAGAFIAMMIHFVFVSSNPNGSLAKNLEAAHTEVENGILQVISRGEPPAHTSVSVFRVGVVRTILIFALATMPFTAAELLRAFSGWSLNEDWFPPVAGAGDAPRCYLASRISIKGMWAGSGKAILQNAEELGLQPDALVVKSRAQDWHDTIMLQDQDWDWPARIYGAVDLADSQFAKQEGKTLALVLSVEAKYPVKSSHERDKYYEQTVAVAQAAMLTLSPPGAGKTYVNTWIAGHLSGLAVLALFGWYLYRRAKRVPRSTTRNYPFENAENPPPAVQAEQSA